MIGLAAMTLAMALDPVGLLGWIAAGIILRSLPGAAVGGALWSLLPQWILVSAQVTRDFGDGLILRMTVGALLAAVAFVIANAVRCRQRSLG